jgi:hypothetical protein
MKSSYFFNAEGTSHYAKAGPRKHMKQAKQVNLEDAVMNGQTQQCSCGMNIRSRYQNCCRYNNKEYKNLI